MQEKISLFEWSKLPMPFGVTVLILSLIFLLSPYLSGTDFGIFKIPAFSENAKRWLRIIGPVAFVLCVCSFLPLWPASTVNRTSGTANSNVSISFPSSTSPNNEFRDSASTSIQAQEANLLRCDNVLLQANASVLQSDSRSAAAWLTLVNQTNYEQAKTDADARYKVIFGANYSQFNERRREYLSVQKSSYSASDARSEMQIALSQFQVEAWARCIEATTSNNVLTLAAIDPTLDSATVVIRWRPAGGVGNISRITSDLHGAAPGSQLLDISTILPGARGFIVRRVSPGAAVRGVISGVIGNAYAVQANVLVPEIRPPQPFVPVNRSEAHYAARSGSLAQLLDAIVRGWDVNSDIDDERNVMLHLAAEGCNEGKVRALIDAGSANRPNKWSDTPHNIAKARCGANHPVTTLTSSL